MGECNCVLVTRNVPNFTILPLSPLEYCFLHTLPNVCS